MFQRFAAHLWLRRGACFVALALLLASIGAARPTRAQTTIMDVACGDTAGLLDAIRAASAMAEGGVVALAADCTYTVETPDNDSEGSTALPPITSDVTITGSNTTITRASENITSFRMMYVAAGARLTLQGVTISGGLLFEPIVCPGGVDPRTGGPPTGEAAVRPSDFTAGGLGILNRGTLVLTDSVVADNYGTLDGVGIFSSGAVRLYRSTVRTNSTGIYNGAGVFNDGGTLELEQSTVADNFSCGRGTGIFSEGGTVEVLRSTVSGNSDGGASGKGAGIYATGTLTVTESTLANNSTGGDFSDGGAIWSSGRLIVDRSTISGNTTGGDGGAVHNADGSAELLNVTISGNTADGNGGGVYSTGALSMTSVTVISNTADMNANGLGGGGGLFSTSADLSVWSSIIAENADTPANGGPLALRPDVVAPTQQVTPTERLFLPLLSAELTATLPISDVLSLPGQVARVSYNLIGVGDDGLFAHGVDGNQVGTADAPLAALLAPLADNGGPTQTHALLPGSPALDAANPAAPGSGPGACPPTDQRGVARPQGPRCDIGAVEAQTEGNGR